MTVLETRRTVLRQFTWDDLDELAELYADAELMRYIAGGKPRTREETAQRLEEILRWQAEHGLSLWATVDRQDGRLLGRCGLIARGIGGRPDVEVGYMIARPLWGRGLATEVVSALREYAFGECGLWRLIALIMPGNMASVRVAEKAGLSYERDIELFNRSVHLYAIEAGKQLGGS